jgi:hypothetical protein
LIHLPIEIHLPKRLIHLPDRAVHLPNEEVHLPRLEEFGAAPGTGG